jgi:hypothetical protein
MGEIARGAAAMAGRFSIGRGGGSRRPVSGGQRRDVATQALRKRFVVVVTGPAPPSRGRAGIKAGAAGVEPGRN